MSEIQIYFWSIICLFASGGVIPLLITLRWKSNRVIKLVTILSLALALVGSGMVTFYALKVLMMGGDDKAFLFSTDGNFYNLPTLALTVYVDHLAAFFLLLIGGLSSGICIYSFAYLSQKADRAQIAGAYNLFVLSEVLFVSANNVFFFVLLLECATLACGFLVLHEHYEKPYEPENWQAIKTYLIANHIGGMFILAASLILALSLALSHQGFTFDMSVFRQAKSTIDYGTDNLIFFLALIGFGIKAGIAPFHIWVSIAHPKLPTNTHAMTVGIMIKVALYGMVRFFFQFLHPIPWWWGFIVLFIAAVTALMGVRNALYGRTLKDSLADHSVENIGIILAGIGLALIFASYQRGSVIYSLTGLALAAGLYHLLNHTVFKGLLYLCTGAIEYLTNGVVELKRLGGLIHRFRWTSVCFLIGSVAIAGFPPFNGFISEWLTLQALIAGINLLSQNWVLLSGIILSTLLLASAFALTALAFVKIAGEVLLGKPRNESILDTSEQVKGDVPWRMRGILIILSILCLVLGLFPWLVMTLLGMIVSDLGFPLTSARAFSFWGGIAISAGSYSADLRPQFLFVLFGLLIVVFPLAIHASLSVKNKAVWTGGVQYDWRIMQYTSSTFTSPVRDFLERTLILVLPTLLVKRLDRLSMSQPSTSEVPSIKTRFELSEGRTIGEPFRHAYNGLINLLQGVARATGSLVQNGDLRNYLLYIFLFFITVFIVLTGVNK